MTLPDSSATDPGHPPDALTRTPRFDSLVSECDAQSLEVALSLRPNPETAAHAPLRGDVALDPRGLGVIDRRALVWKRGAFPSFANPDDYEHTRRVLGSRLTDIDARRGGAPAGAPLPPRWETGRGGGFRSAERGVLPAIHCAHTEDDGRRCGQTVHLVRSGPAFYYKSPRCETLGHSPGGSQEHIDHAVIEIVRRCFSESSLTQAIVAALDQSQVIEARVRRCAEMVSAAGRVYEHYSRVEKEALIRQDAIDIEHYRSERRKAQQQRDMAQSAYTNAVAERAQAERRPNRSVLFDTARRIGNRIPDLLEAARPHPVLMRRILSELIRDVGVSDIAPSFCLIEVELCGGVRVQALLCTSRIRSTQPARVWCAAALGCGRSPVAVEAELIAAGVGRGLARPDGGNAITLALVHRYFESQFADPEVSRPANPWRTLADLATEMDIPLSEVCSAGLGGALGPATVIGDSLHVAPDLSTLHRRFPSYARRWVADSQGWPLM